MAAGVSDLTGIERNEECDELFEQEFWWCRSNQVWQHEGVNDGEVRQGMYRRIEILVERRNTGNVRGGVCFV